MTRTLRTTLAALVLAVSGASAQAASVSFTGNLAGDNAVQLFSFALDATSDVTLRTWSYNGGTNSAGNPISAGGFDPVVSLFFGLGDSALLIDTNDDGLGVANDSLLERFGLGAGSYTVSLSQVANFAIGPTLGDGFLGFGNTDFDGRSSAWALDIVNVARADLIPEPSALALSLLALVAMGAGPGALRRVQRPLRLR